MALNDPGNVGLWVFGYGSIIWRPAFPYESAHRASVHGWARRFWQGSHDHRGTAESPGRVLTLVPMQNSVCVGRVFSIAQTNVAGVLKDLDYREKNGYERQHLQVDTLDHGPIGALTYIATSGNPAWLGDAPDSEIAEQIRNSHGPSGSNRDYVLSLSQALQDDGIEDEHLQSIATLLSQ